MIAPTHPNLSKHVLWPGTPDWLTASPAEKLLPAVATPVPLLAATDRNTTRVMTAFVESEMMPAKLFPAETLSTTLTSNRIELRELPTKAMPCAPLLYTSTWLNTTFTAPVPLGWTKIPLPPLSATKVCDIVILAISRWGNINPISRVVADDAVCHRQGKHTAHQNPARVADPLNRQAAQV